MSKGAVIVHDEEELMNELGKYDTEQIYIIGGNLQDDAFCIVIKFMWQKVDRAFQADTYFPNLDEMSEWKMTQESEEQTCLIWILFYNIWKMLRKIYGADVHRRFSFCALLLLLCRMCGSTGW